MSKKDIQNAGPDQSNPVGLPIQQTLTGLADNITSADLRLPRIALLQSKSPEVENDTSGTHRAGMFIDTLTEGILDIPITFVPVFIFKNVIKWKPRSEGGGMVYRSLDFKNPQVLKDIQWDGSNKPTADIYINAVCLVQGHDVPLIISFSKTSLKAGQDLATLVQLSGQAWKFNYMLSSMKVANPKGTFFIMKVKRGALTGADTIVEAASLYEQVKDMAIDTDFEPSHEPEPATDAAPSEF